MRNALQVRPVRLDREHEKRGSGRKGGTSGGGGRWVALRQDIRASELQLASFFFALPLSLACCVVALGCV